MSPLSSLPGYPPDEVRWSRSWSVSGRSVTNLSIFGHSSSPSPFLFCHQGPRPLASSSHNCAGAFPRLTCRRVPGTLVLRPCRVFSATGPECVRRATLLSAKRKRRLGRPCTSRRDRSSGQFGDSSRPTKAGLSCKPLQQFLFSVTVGSLGSSVHNDHVSAGYSSDRACGAQQNSTKLGPRVYKTTKYASLVRFHHNQRYDTSMCYPMADKFIFIHRVHMSYT